VAFIGTTLIQGERKATQPIPDTCSIFQKINYIEIRKKSNVILSAGNVHRVQRCMHSLFSSSLMQTGKEFPCQGNGSPDEILSMCLAQEKRKMYPETHSGKLSKNEMSGSVRQWTLVAFMKKTSLHFDCWKDNWRTGASRIQHDVTCVGSCIVTAILCVY
jgi:hypothetical protein